MYRANFYGQSAASSHFTRMPWINQDFSMSLTARAMLQGYGNQAADSFHSPALSPFEQRLKSEVEALKKLENDIKEEMSAQKSSELSQQKKQEIQARYSIIDRSKKFLALMVEHMQKSMQNIAANFR